MKRIYYGNISKSLKFNREIEHNIKEIQKIFPYFSMVRCENPSDLMAWSEENNKDQYMFMVKSLVYENIPGNNIYYFAKNPQDIVHVKLIWSVTY